jgi:hypothetical protein
MGSSVPRRKLATNTDVAHGAVKAVRWLVGGIVGALDPVAGAALSVVDAFLVDNVLRTGDARYFVDDTLRRIETENCLIIPACARALCATVSTTPTVRTRG